MRSMLATLIGFVLLAAAIGGPAVSAQEPGCTGEACATETVAPTPTPGAPQAGNGMEAGLVSTGEAIFIVAMATLALGGLVLAVVPGRRAR